MDEGQFFHKWIGNTITIKTTPEPSSWRLEEKLSEKHDQPTAYGFNRDKIDYGRHGGAYGTFTCRNIANDSEEAVMKVLMQVPWEGSEYVSAGERAKQATQALTETANLDINPLLILTANGCGSAPLVRAHQKGTQDDSGLVPGGFLHFLLMDKAPGQQLSMQKFWGFDRQVRDEIREAFRVAWDGYCLDIKLTFGGKQCLCAGVKPVSWGPTHLYWNPEFQKIFIAGFRDAEAAGPDDHWTDFKFVAWDLADCPDNVNWQTSKDPHPDMSKWKL